jgi:hypothetical protein
MSLINDALKRASQSDRNRPAQAALPSLMQPVAPQPRAGTPWLMGAVFAGALCLVLAGWFFWKWWGAAHPNIADAPAQPAQTIVAEPNSRAPEPTPVIRKNPSPPGAVAAPAVVAAPVAPASDSWPIDLTVKAIFFSKTNPRALVNGRTLGTGDTIDGVLVTGILSDRVFVDWKGQSKVIVLGGQ